MARRSGGRAGRVALRAKPLAKEARAVWPGIEGGKFKPLSDRECAEVFEAALTMLEDIGMGQATPEFIELVTADGGRMDEHERLRFPRDLVRRCLDSAAREFTVHGLNSDEGIELGGNRVHFSTAGAAVLMLDHETQQFRHTTVRDVYDCARVGDTLDNIHMFVRTVVARDMELSRDVDLNTAYATMMGTSKPQGTSMFEPEHVHEIVAMYDMALGGEGQFRRRPFCVASNTFVVPPLRFANDSALCMAEARLGMPINLLSAGQAGATSPAALAGSLVQALAECLAALTCVNLIAPGHPCIRGLWPFVSDLRTGAMSGGSGEEAILNAAAAQVAGSYLGLPVGVAAGMADSKLPDNQAGHEKGLAVGLAANAGANIVYESAGMLASLMACSLEAMVVDNDMLGAINRTVRGIEITPDSLSTEAMKDVVYGAGHFLGHEQTLSIMQSEYTYPMVGDRNSPDDWIDAGAKNVTEVAHEYVTRTLASHLPDHVPAENVARIRAAFPSITLETHQRS